MDNDASSSYSLTVGRMTSNGRQSSWCVLRKCSITKDSLSDQTPASEAGMLNGPENACHSRVSLFFFPRHLIRVPAASLVITFDRSNHSLAERRTDLQWIPDDALHEARPLAFQRRTNLTYPSHLPSIEAPPPTQASSHLMTRRPGSSQQRSL